MIKIDDYPDDGADADCIHISFTEQAEGWLICDDCGEDVTLEICRANQQGRAS
ncbi:MAG TPA: hypothetical protein VGR95_12480 [Thermoanaerobaculia bacterium]|jgi:hypothetical protein|nr:hypothetical protein [Thermoanaerobaculia bacterium]